MRQKRKSPKSHVPVFKSITWGVFGVANYESELKIQDCGRKIYLLDTDSTQDL